MVSDIWLRLGLTFSQAASSIISTLNVPKGDLIPASQLCLAEFLIPADCHCCPLAEHLSDFLTFLWFSSFSGKFTRRGSSDAATEMESLSARHSHSHHTLVSDPPHFAFLHFFSMGMVLIPVSCTMSRTSVHSSSGTLSIRSSP